MRKPTFRAAGRGRPTLAVVAVAVLSMALHVLVLRWGGLSMRVALPAPSPTVIMATVRPQSQSQPEVQPQPEVEPISWPARRLPKRPFPPVRPDARGDAPVDVAATSPPGRRVAIAPARIAEASTVQPDADALHAALPAAPEQPATPEATVRIPGGGQHDGTPWAANRSGEPLVAGQDAPAAARTAPQPSVVEPVAADASSASPAPPPESIELRFDAYLENLGGDARIGDARFSLHAADGRYRMMLEASGPLSRFAYASSGVLGAHGFQPQRFSELRRVAFRARVARTVTFVMPLASGALSSDDMSTDTPNDASGGAPTEAITLHVPPETQDRLSVLFQLWLMMRDRPERLVAGQEIVLPLASMKGHEQATFLVGPVEPFVLDARPVAAVRLTRVSGSARASGIEVWLAAQAPHLPVGLRYVERDRAVRFIATGPG